MKGVWEVKCYHCSRVCGLLVGGIWPIALLTDLSRVRRVPRCGVLEQEVPRCDQCGGQLYTEEADVISVTEALSHPSLN